MGKYGIWSLNEVCEQVYEKDLSSIANEGLPPLFFHCFPISLALTLTLIPLLIRYFVPT